MIKDDIKRISLWSGPRNISTTLMYSFAQRDDCLVFDEPLYAHYLKNSEAKTYHPGVNQILKSQENDGEKVIQELLSCKKKSVLFFKNMTHHLLDLDRSFLPKMTNVILTRNPVEMLPSFAEVIDQPELKDVGYQAHVELMDYFQENDIPFIVLDSTRVLKNPKEQLQQLCQSIGIPFQESMLSWKKGSRKEDGVWAPFWYKNVHNSTGFIKYSPKKEAFPEKLKPLLAECEPYYKSLKKFAL